jgi:hypothetical protein
MNPPVMTPVTGLIVTSDMGGRKPLPFLAVRITGGAIYVKTPIRGPGRSGHYQVAASTGRAQP